MKTYIILFFTMLLFCSCKQYKTTGNISVTYQDRTKGNFHFIVFHYYKNDFEVFLNIKDGMPCAVYETANNLINITCNVRSIDSISYKTSELE